MMKLQETIPNEELLDTERFDFLRDIHQFVKRMDEIHPSEDDDWNHVYLVWLKSENLQFDIISKMRINTQGNDWHFHVEVLGDLVIIQTYPLW